jgi:parallel beta-helix repeat protein
MSVLSVQPTFPIFTEADGQPLENGYIWIGTANLDPQVNPISVYWDAALTQPAVQPIRTINGYPAKSGSPGRLYVNSDYSIRVQNKNGSAIYSAPASTDKYSSELITFLPAGTGAVATTVQAKLRETVSVKDFGAKGDGVTDDTVAIQNAVNACSAGSTLLFPLGIYLISSTITIATASVMLKGVSNPEYITVPTIKMTSGSNFMFDCTNAGVVFEGLKFLGNGITYGASSTVNGVRCSAASGTDCDNYFNSCSFVYLNKCVEVKGKNVNAVNTLFSNSLYGLYLDRNSAVAADFRGLSVTGCRFHSLGGASTAAYGIYVASYAAEANFRELIFVGNYVDDSYAAIYGCINSATITGNMFTRMRGAGSTIEIDLTNSTFTANLRNIVISGNSLFCNDTTNTSTGIKITSTCYPLIANNELNQYQYHGISLSGISGFLITGNTVYTCGAAASNLYDGINISGTTVGGGVVSANRIIGAGTGRSGIYIQSTNNPGTNNRNLLSNNYVSSYSTPITLSAANVAVSNTFGAGAVLDCVKNSALGGTGTFTLTPGVDSPVQRQATTLTADVTVNMASSNVYDGAYFRIIRTGAGAFNMNVVTGSGTAVLTQNQYIETIFSAQAGAWIPVAKGSIV